MKKLMIAATGKDQEGIVAAFSHVLFDNNCNIEDTNMTILEDQFAMLFIVTAPETLKVDHLKQNFVTVLKDFHLHMDVHEIDTELETLSSSGTPWMVSTSGSDQTGIMFHVTQYLAKQKINVRHLSSKRLSRPGGEKLFLMALEIDVPGSLSEEQFLSDLKSLSDKEQLEIHAERLESYTL